MVEFPANGKCPKCGAPIAYGGFEVHPVRSDVAEKHYDCENCGRVKIGEVSLRPERKRQS